MFPMDRKPVVVTVEYTARGARVRKTFPTAYEARRFYTAKSKAGAAPRVIAQKEQAMTEQQNVAAGSTGKPAQKQDRRTFASEAEARAAGPLPGNERWRLWCVTGPRGGAPLYLWANGEGMATVRGARADGTVVVCLDKPAKALTRETIAAGLAALTPEDRAILIAAFVPAPVVPVAAVTVTAPNGGTPAESAMPPRGTRKAR
jgi:hypothetical protein